MKKLFLLSLLAAGALSANALTVSFENCKSGSTINLPEGWEFLYQSRQTYKNDAGGLYFDHPAAWGGDNSYLISPVMTGQVTFTYTLTPVKGYGDWYDSNYDGSIYVYHATKSGDTYEVSTASSNKIFSEALGCTNKTSSFTLTSPGQVAFALSNGALIEVTYTPSDETVEEPAYQMTLNTLNLATGSNNVVADSEGNVALDFTIVAKNTGSETLTPATEGLVFSCTNPNVNEICNLTWTGDVTSIAPGETATINLTGSFPISLFSSLSPSTTNGSYYQRFDVTSTYSTSSAPLRWLNVYPYTIFYRIAKSGSIDVVKEVDYGFVNYSTRNYDLQLVNLGGRELTVTSVSCPLGFSVNLTTPFTLSNALGTTDERTANFQITADTNLPGIHEGYIEFEIEGLDEPVQIKVKDVVPGGDTYYVNFDNGQNPAGWIIPSGLTYPSPINLGNGNSKALANTYSSSTLRAITPLLHFNEGDQLAFQAYSQYYTNAYSCVTVYTSTNRGEWTEIAKIKNSGVGDELSFPGRYSSSSSGSMSALGTYVLPMDEGDVYLAFDICYAGIDNIFGGELVPVEHDLMFTAVEVGTEAMVNYPYTPAITVKNVGTEDEAENTFVVSMLIDGANVVTIEDTPEINVNSEASFVLPYTFHQTGEHTVLIEVREGDYVLATNQATVNVSEESTEPTIIVGPSTPNKNDSSCKIAPMYFYDKKSQGFMVLTADYLARYGITPGTSITGLSFNGYLETAKTNLDGTIEAWLFPTEQSTIVPADGATLIENLTDANRVGSAEIANSYPTTKPGEFFKIEFDAPYEYTGGNLMLGLVKIFNAWSTDFFFNCNKDLGACGIYRSSDTDYTSQAFSQASAIAQLNLYTLNNPKTYSGLVVSTSGNTPVADALITLTSGDVIYNGTSAADGTFSIEVLQSKKDYDVLVTAANYNDYTSTASFADGNVVTTIELTPEVGDGIGSVNADKVNVRIEGNMIFVDGVDAAVLSIFNAAGQMMTRADATAISIANLNAGVYVLNVKSANGTASVKFVKR